MNGTNLHTLHDAMPSLAKKMVLVRLKTTKRVRRTARDKNAEELLATTYGTDTRDWNVSKKLFQGSERYQRANRSRYELEKFVKAKTSAWFDDGLRALPNAKYMTFTATVNPLKQEAVAAYDDFRQNYWAEVDADIQRRNAKARAAGKAETASRDDYPDQPPDTEIRVIFQPVPTRGDFRTEMTEEDTAEFDAMLADAENTIKTDIIKRALAPVSQLAERLTQYTGDKGQRWHAEVVNAALDSCRDLESLNVDGDGEIADLLARTREALRVTAQPSIKDSQSTRDEARAKFDDILSKFA